MSLASEFVGTLSRLAGSLVGFVGVPGAILGLALVLLLAGVTLDGVR